MEDNQNQLQSSSSSSSSSSLSNSNNIVVDLSFESLMCETERMNRTFMTLDADWNLKMENLSQIQKWLVSGLSETQYCTQVIDSMKEGISVLLEDRRSILCKETCFTITAIASHFGLKSEPLVKFFIPTLLKLLVVTIKVISESSHTCILSLLPFAPSSLPIVLQGTTEKHPVLRSRCAEYLFGLLSSSPNDFLVQYLEPLPDFNHTLFSVITSILMDSSQEVRSHGKKCYNTLKPKFPAQTQKFYSELDPSIQKRLVDEDKGKPSSSVRDFKKMMLQKKRENYEVESNMDVLKPSIIVELSEKKDDIVVNSSIIIPPSNSTKNLVSELPSSEPVSAIDTARNSQDKESFDRLVGSKSKADPNPLPLPLSEIPQDRLLSSDCTNPSPAKTTPPPITQTQSIEPSKKVMKKGKKGKENILEPLGYHPGSTPIAVRVKRRSNRRLVHRD